MAGKSLDDFPAQELQEELYQCRLKFAKMNKSPPWTMKDLEVALKKLKTRKCRDPEGLIRYVFKEGVIGDNLKESLLILFNKIKESQVKQETIDHIIETIHLMRAKYDNDINFIIGGDFNRLDINDILESYGGLKQIVSVPNRKSATLQLILTDLHTMYHPPTTLPPLQVDEDKNGKDGDHDIMLFATKNNTQYRTDRVRKTVTTRPIPESQISRFENELARYPWDQVFEGKNVNDKVSHFHRFLRTQLDKYFPEKVSKMTNLDKKWMTPALKQLHRVMQREFFRHRKSEKYKKLKCKFKKMKRKAVKNFYSDFVNNLKKSDPGKWYAMAKKIGAVDHMTAGEVKVESLAQLNNKDSAEEIAKHFASISNEYSPINHAELPCYLPAPPPPQSMMYT